MTILKTAVPDVTITENGLDIPDIADVLSGRLVDMQNALGEGASDSLSSPQGQIAQSDTEIIAQYYDKLLCLFNQINPDFAGGRFQDGIGRLYFQDRIAGQGTTVNAVCRGAVGTVIPQGATAQDSAGNLYQSVNAATIGSGNAVTIQFRCTVNGPIDCGIGELNQIYSNVSGWDSVYNEVPGVPGSDVESRIAFEARRKQSVARNGRNTDSALLAALLDISDVIDAYVWSNRTDTTIQTGSTSVSVLPHSVYISVYGGSDENVAKAIFNNYNPGANLNGETTYTVMDNQHYQPPYPEYVMQWHKATAQRVYFKVYLDSSLNPPSDITAQVKERVSEVFNGHYKGIVRARIGSTISAGKYYEPVIAIEQYSVGVNNIHVSLDGTNYDRSVTVGVDEIPVIQEGDIEVILQ